eukprot:TRINITY_DN6509_c0_g1_i1.p1 TRINITY_DN6509_c0_g1~~TRINITY_DN6509_c0_g1_i1.p1  ORF type:complete len:295 (+),score=38.12 TRINITY_DN6509_c0_g1_i1:55-939(+)
MSFNPERIAKIFGRVSLVLSLIGFCFTIYGLWDFVQSFEPHITFLTVCSQDPLYPELCYPNDQKTPSLSYSDLCYARNVSLYYKFENFEKGLIILLPLFLIDLFAFMLAIWELIVKMIGFIFRLKIVYCYKRFVDWTEKCTLRFDIITLPFVIALTILGVVLADNINEDDFVKKVLVGTLASGGEIDMTDCTYDTGNQSPQHATYSYYLMYEYHLVEMDLSYPRLNITKSSFDMNNAYYNDVKDNLEQGLNFGIPLCCLAVVSLICTFLSEFFERKAKSGSRDTVQPLRSKIDP